MSDHIDTSPAALSELADMFDGNYPREVIDALRAVAAEKEAQTKQEPEGYTWIDFSGKSRHVGKAPPSDGAYNIQPLYLAPQHLPQQARCEGPHINDEVKS